TDLRGTKSSRLCQLGTKSRSGSISSNPDRGAFPKANGRIHPRWVFQPWPSSPYAGLRPGPFPPFCLSLVWKDEGLDTGVMGASLLREIFDHRLDFWCAVL